MAEDLWNEAVKTLSDEDRRNIAFSGRDKLDILGDVLKEAEKRKEECLKKRWRFKRSNGDDVILRDLFEKIVTWVNKFREIGDIAMQYDPGHAALPWAGIRFLLQVGAGLLLSATKLSKQNYESTGDCQGIRVSCLSMDTVFQYSAIVDKFSDT